MNTLTRLKDLRAAVRSHRLQERRIALVPTMGNLHDGHLALVRRAMSCADIVVTSIFVNPMQFGPNEDLAAYPRTLAADKEALVEVGNHILYCPGVEQIYPEGQEQATRVRVPQLGRDHCGASRPGHFEGVATVVSILFNQVQPDVAVFGEKDFQQLAIIRKLVADLCFPVQIEGVPTHREANGLAMSSRNRYLSAAQREQAATLYATLQWMRDEVLAGRRDYRQLEEQARQQLQAAGFTPDYCNIVHPDSLEAATPEDASLTILAAAGLGPTRLIDNLSFTLPA